MSLLDNQTKVNLGTSFYALSGSGGGGGGGDVTFSTITLTGTNPISATLASAPNDGFEVRNGGGGSNVITITTIDAGNPARAEMGIRSLSTISGNAVPRGRFEQTLVPSTDAAALTYTLDTVGAGNNSTIGSVTFTPGTTGSSSGAVAISSEDTTKLTIGNGRVEAAPSKSQLVPVKAAAQSGGQVYVPAAGTAQLMANFSTISGHAYEMWIPDLRIKNEPAAVPAAGAWANIYVDTSPAISYLDTIDMASVSTIANDLTKCANYTFTASGFSHTLNVAGSLSNSVSTSVTFGPAVYLRDLGDPTQLKLVG